MTDLDLARRAVACKKWRWMPGMLDDYGMRLSHVTLHDGSWGGQNEYRASMYHKPKLPDFTDPATIGCLLALVREAWKSPLAQVSPMLPQGGWVCYPNNTDERYGLYFRGETEASALVAALEAAQ